MAYKDYPDTPAGRKERAAFYESKDGLALIEGWRRQGLKVDYIAKECIGISPEAFRKWRHKNPELQKSLDVAIEICNSHVEDSLYRRACGYDYWEEQWELIEGELRIARKYKKHLPPDVRAIMMWLYNKMPNQYRAMQEPLEKTQYTEAIKNIVVAMKEVADGAQVKRVEFVDD